MTLPYERVAAVNETRDFLRDLLDRTKTPRVPKEVRERAHRLLRHYPWAMYVEQLSSEPENLPNSR